jgi:hypothetical protein
MRFTKLATESSRERQDSLSRRLEWMNYRRGGFQQPPRFFVRLKWTRSVQLLPSRTQILIEVSLKSSSSFIRQTHVPATLKEHPKTSVTYHEESQPRGRSRVRGKCSWLERYISEMYSISRMQEPRLRIVASNLWEQISYGLIENILGSCVGRPEPQLQFGPGLLDWVQVGQIRQQVT